MKEFTTDFIPVPFEAIKDKNLDQRSRIILGIIYYITEKRGDKFFMSNQYIADTIGSTPNSVNNSLLKLEQNGYIQRVYNAERTQRLEIKCLIKLQKHTSTDVGGTLTDVGGTLTGAHNKIPNKIKELNIVNLDSIKERFDEIRIRHKSKLKGKARGLETEWEYFLTKNRKPTMKLLEEMEAGAMRYLDEELKKSDRVLEFTPMFKTWINQRRWEEYTRK